MIEFIDSNKDDGNPFFAYAAYTSPHWPLQVPDEYLDSYAGRYDDGYDALRETNFAALKAAGIIPLESSLPPRNEAVTPWENLSSDEQRQESRKMELYAAMVDNLAISVPCGVSDDLPIGFQIMARPLKTSMISARLLSTSGQTSITTMKRWEQLSRLFHTACLGQKLAPHRSCGIRVLRAKVGSLRL